ncbi:MAG: DUF2283 domain-containing protein [Candidatus Nanoarchaeia archaeon]|nr:DUF2283 domain-containing protein [Candidatus Nanoarchaeia archaeon]
MKAEYDPDADAMYIYFSEEQADSQLVLDENVIIDMNKKNEILGIEILFVKERNPKILEKIKFENLSAETQTI